MHHPPHGDRRLRIGIDAHALGSGLGGNETYLRCLLQGLSHHPEHDYILYTSYPGSNEVAERLLPGSICHHVSANPLRRLGIDLSIASWRHGLDLLHLQYVSPLFTGCPVSLLIHDLSYEHSPDWFRSSEVRRFRWTIPRSAVASNVVLTVSQYCKEDIARRLHLPPDKIVVTPNALPPCYQPADDGAVDSLRERLDLPSRYILALGNLQPRKNITTLLQAWKMIRHHPDMKDVSLVVTGKKAWLYDEILHEAGVEGLSGERIQFTGYLPEADLPALYSGALLFVYPSLFEGFGLPPIEAMACGTPVLVGRNSALPEVCGEAAKYADVTSPEPLGAAILEMALNEEERRMFSAAGIAHSRSFNLENLTAPTLRAWESIARTN
mgnify:CR=1 FL=1